MKVVSSKGKIIIRFDAGGDAGFGHAVRSISLASQLRDVHGHDVVLAINGEATRTKMLAGLEYDVVQKDPSTTEEAFLSNLVRGTPDCVLVIDHLHPFKYDFMAELRHNVRVATIQNSSEGALAADLAVFPVGHLDDAWVSSALDQNDHRRIVYGMKYVMIADQVRDVATVPAGDYIALTTGGSDPANLLLTWINWLSESDPGVHVRALFGAAFQAMADLERLKDRVPPWIEIAPFSHSILFRASLAVSTFGVTPYELIYKRIPVITVGHTERAAAASDRLAERYGASVSLGGAKHLEAPAFLSAIKHWSLPSHRLQLRSRQKGLIDGHGLARIVAEIRSLVRREP